MKNLILIVLTVASLALITFFSGYMHFFINVPCMIAVFLPSTFLYLIKIQRTNSRNDRLVFFGKTCFRFGVIGAIIFLTGMFLANSVGSSDFIDNLYFSGIYSLLSFGYGLLAKTLCEAFVETSNL